LTLRKFVCWVSCIPLCILCLPLCILCVTCASHNDIPGMIFIPSGNFYISETEVTNTQFKKFTDATGYKTVAERKPTWDELKKNLPAGTPVIIDSLLVPGSLVFVRPSVRVRLDDPSQWWKFIDSADWRHPEGPHSNLDNRWDHPVVHIAYEDALAYCKWEGSRLPTEKEWELAAHESTYSDSNGKLIANTFQGSFPLADLKEDGFATTAPVRSYPPNDLGLYDMIGNVWEWTSDVYDIEGTRVTKGGSYLCGQDYCSNYFPSSRQGSAEDTGVSNIGFRTVRD
jgi:sulfatase modifying factor 1